MNTELLFMTHIYGRHKNEIHRKSIFGYDQPATAHHIYSPLAVALDNCLKGFKQVRKIDPLYTLRSFESVGI